MSEQDDRPPMGRSDASTAADWRDIEAIRRLKARYFRLIDQQDWRGVGELFAPGATVDVSSSTVSGSGQGVYDAPERFVAMLSKALHGAVTVHHGHTDEIEMTGADTARGVWAMEDRIWFPEGSPIRTLWGAGWYEEDYQRVEGRWRIVRMVLHRQRVELDGEPLVAGPFAPAPEPG